MNEFQKQVYDAIVSVGGESYSGRGMFGNRCIGITGDSLEDCLLSIVNEIELSKEDSDMIDATELCSSDFIRKDHLEALFNLKVDSMGRGIVVYWPELEVDD